MMEPSEGLRLEENLDPQDWEAMRALGHEMVDEMMTYLQTVRDRYAWQPMPEAVKAQFSEPIPYEPEGAEKAYEDFREYVLPYPSGNIHPRFWGWVMGTGTPLGMLAEMLAAGMNPNLAGGDHAAAYVEEQVLNWFKVLMGFPEDASGLLVSGGSMANLVGLTVARNAKAEYDLRREGLGAAPRKMMLYSSSETHSSNQKAVELLGLGSEALRKIAVNEDYQVDIQAMDAAIAEDRENGYLPFCIIGNAGTVNTGAIDNLNGLADICEREDLWFHVDGAFGAVAALSRDLKPLVGGMERADSLAFDLHKWVYLPFEAGCVLVKHEEQHRKTFSLTPDYLTHTDRGLGGGAKWPSDYGVQLSRNFRALKAWMSLKEHGVLKYGRMIKQNVEQARYLANLVDTTAELERLSPVPLNVVCFRYKAQGLDDERLNEVNEEILLRLQESGVAVPSYTTLNGKYALRAAVTNQRSRRDDFEMLVEEVVRIGGEVVEDL